MFVEIKDPSEELHEKVGMLTITNTHANSVKIPITEDCMYDVCELLDNLLGIHGYKNNLRNISQLISKMYKYDIRVESIFDAVFELALNAERGVSKDYSILKFLELAYNNNRFYTVSDTICHKDVRHCILFIVTSVNTNNIGHIELWAIDGSNSKKHVYLLTRNDVNDVHGVIKDNFNKNIITNIYFLSPR